MLSSAESQRRTLYFDNEEDFQSAWTTKRKVPVLSSTLPDPDEAIHRVAHFAAGMAIHEGFRLFKNGGVPVLEKRRSNRVFEIVFRRGGNGIHGAWAPFTITAHVSDTRLKLQRELYWKPASSAPAVIATCQMAQLDIPPRWAIYDAYASHEEIEGIAEHILRDVAPWFSLFIRPSAMLERLRLGQIPHIQRDTALELVILELGEDEAIDFLFSLLDSDPELNAVVREEIRRIASAQRPRTNISPEFARISVIAARLGLLSRY